MTGVEFGGALKNVIAIAAGVVEGLGIGHNAMAALITRGLVEMSRLACAEGSRRETLAGLSGLGDLVLTCTGDLSRNRHVGIELGPRPRAAGDPVADMRMVAEGVRTTGAALALGARHGVELPLAAQMSAVLEGPHDRARGGRGPHAAPAANRRTRSLPDLHGFFRQDQASLTRTKEQFVERFDEIVRRADEPAQRSRAGRRRDGRGARRGAHLRRRRRRGDATGSSRAVRGAAARAASRCARW